MNITAGLQTNGPAHSKEKRQAQGNCKVLFKFAKFSMITCLLPNIGPAQQTDKDENKYNPIHDVDDAKGYQ